MYFLINMYYSILKMYLFHDFIRPVFLQFQKHATLVLCPYLPLFYFR